MTDLIDRLEQAEAGSRELSDEVLLALGWSCNDRIQGKHPKIFGKYWRHPVNRNDGYWDGDQPDPTQSVDHALKLVPDGWLTRHSQQFSKWLVEIKGDGEHEAWAASLPLALSIAIIRAHEQGGAGS